MRNERGYCGPVSHWWESNLLYCGPMIDWRYEGIISGYVTLFSKTHQLAWLEKATRAADDALQAQLPNGSFLNSSFQLGPFPGGTPHEAAVDVGLLELAKTLSQLGDRRASGYFQAAERNIRRYLLGTLWNGQGFMDQPWNPVLVANKNATTIEALLLYEELGGGSMQEFLLRAAQVVLQAQVKAGPRVGATIHRGTGNHRLAISIYTARSLCGLMKLHDRYPSQDHLKFVLAALPFLYRLVTDSGVHFGMYRDGRGIRSPRWIAGAGDILRALLLAARHLPVDATVTEQLVHVLLTHQDAAGGIRTAYGFAQKGATTDCAGPPELRDVLPVVGWCDKAFRALTMLADDVVDAPNGESRILCTWKGKPCEYIETREEIRLEADRCRYRWVKGESFPEVYEL